MSPQPLQMQGLWAFEANGVLNNQQTIQAVRQKLASKANCSIGIGPRDVRKAFRLGQSQWALRQLLAKHSP